MQTNIVAWVLAILEDSGPLHTRQAWVHNKNASYLTCLLVINMANLERGNMREPCLSTLIFIKNLGCEVGGKSFYNWIHKLQKLNNISKNSF